MDNIKEQDTWIEESLDFSPYLAAEEAEETEEVMAADGNEPEIEKLMIYELLRVDGHYQLTAIRDLPTGSSQAPTGWNTFGEQTRPGLTSSQAAPVPEEQAEADASSASEDTEDEEDVEDEEDSSAPEEDAEDEEDSSAPAEDAEDEETSSAA